MIWWTWRQHRALLLTTVAPLGLLGLGMVASGHGLANEYQHLGIGGCLASGHDCSSLTNQFINAHHGVVYLLPLLLAIPGLIGVFWGAPLVARELETGTHRLAWVQSVTPGRWLAIKLAVLGLAATVLSALFSALVSWWSGPLAAAQQNQFSPGVFDIRGIVPIAYGIFAFALGVTAGTILRRTVAAMGATLITFGIVRAIVALVLRQHFQSPVTQRFAFTDNARTGSNWVLSRVNVDKFGHVLGYGRGISLTVPPVCSSMANASKSALNTCIQQQLGIQTIVKVQPFNRYWYFQTIESTIFVVLAVGMLGVTWWWLRHRLS